MKLFLKGERCLTDKCGVERRSLPAGRARPRPQQAVRVPRPAAREAEGAPLLRPAREAVPHLLREGSPPARASPGENLLRIARDARFDNVARTGSASPRRAVRPASSMRHGHLPVNGRRVNIPSYQVRPDDVDRRITPGTPAETGGPRRDRAHGLRCRPGCRPTTTASPARCCASPSARRSTRPCRNSSSSSSTPSKSRRRARSSAPRPLHQETHTALRTTDDRVPDPQDRPPRKSTTTAASFVIEPLDRGFGYTFGNSLRRVLLSSLGRRRRDLGRSIEGVAHEFSTLHGRHARTSTDIILNLKNIVCRHARRVAPRSRSAAGRDRPRRRSPRATSTCRPASRSSTRTRTSPPLEKKTKLELYADDRARPRLPPGRGEQVARPADRRRSRSTRSSRRCGASRTRSSRRASASAPTTTSSRSTSRPTARSTRRQRSREAARDPDLASWRSSPTTTASRRCARGRGGSRARERRRRGGGARRPPGGAPDGEHPDRGARARRALVQLPQAGRASRRSATSSSKTRGRAGRDPELRQEVDRRGQGDPRRARPEPPRRD